MWRIRRSDGLTIGDMRPLVDMEEGEIRRGGEMAALEQGADQRRPYMKKGSQVEAISPYCVSINAVGLARRVVSTLADGRRIATMGA